MGRNGAEVAGVHSTATPLYPPGRMHRSAMLRQLVEGIEDPALPPPPGPPACDGLGVGQTAPSAAAPAWSPGPAGREQLSRLVDEDHYAALLTGWWEAVGD